MIEAVLAEAGVSAAGIEHILVTTGPGSFTGVRIGLAAVAGLTAGRPIPVTGLSMFEALFWSHDPLPPQPLLIAVDSRRRSTFMALLGEDGKEIVDGREVEDPSTLPPLPERVWLCGDGVGEALVQALVAHGVSVLKTDQTCPDLAKLLAAYPGGGDLSFSLPVPLYMRAPDVSYPKASA